MMDQRTGQTLDSVAERYLDLLASRGIDYIFGNAGTDFPPLIEALAQARHTGRPTPRAVVVPHENVAVAMAHGYYMVTGRMQAVMVHVGLGTANAINGLFNATRLNIPMLLAAGRTPITEGGVFGGRNNYINWAQEMFDQAGMVRELVKWEYELRDPVQLQTVVDRALAIAQSEPRGPVYLTLPREVLAAPAGQSELAPSATQLPAVASEPDPAAIEQLSAWLAEAKRPLIVTASAGNDPALWPALAEFAETYAIPVVQYRPRYMALPTDHPMHCGYNPIPLLRDADLVLTLDCDVPWIPDELGRDLQAKVVHAGFDPLFTRYPVRGFRSDLAIVGSTTALMQRLSSALRAKPGSTSGVKARSEEVARLRRKLAPASAFAAGEVPKEMTSRWVTACIERAKDDTTVLLNEYPLVLEELTIQRPGEYFCHSPAGGLGWAMGAALGVKLAKPEATAIAVIGDGCYMFGNPTPMHMVSRALGLPVLIVICNNGRWGAVHRATLSMYPQGHAAAEDEPPFSCLEPSPDFEHIVRASEGHSERVEDPCELPAAIERALKAVREGRQAVLNVICEAVYARTS
ncbi:MAG: thiamine pyrophosphate-requiring protein [Pseudomonadota bacterium]